MKKLLSLTCLLSIALIAIGFTRYSINAQESISEQAEESTQNGKHESISEDMDVETMSEDTETDEMELDTAEESLEATPEEIGQQEMIEGYMPTAENELETLDLDSADEFEEPIINMEELEALIKASEAAELETTTDSEETDDEDESDEEEEIEDESPSEEDIVEADFDIEQE